mgnify:FL=1
MVADTSGVPVETSCVSAQKKRNHSIVPWLLALVLLGVAYVLSYAPVVKLKEPHSGNRLGAYLFPIDGSELPVYRPVDYLIDETPLREPLLMWADLWSVRETFEFASALRGFPGYQLDVF